MCKTALVTILSLFILTISSTAREKLVFHSPEGWSTLRDDSLSIQFISDESVYESTVSLMLVERNLHGRERIVSRSNADISPSGNTVSMQTSLRNMGGEAYYYLRWAVPDHNLSGTVGPISKYRISSHALNEEIPVPLFEEGSLSDEAVAEQYAQVAEEELPTNVYMAATPEELILAAHTEKTGTIALDPANAKTGFPLFSVRYISLDTAAEMPFYYIDRRSSADTTSVEISYRSREWFGDMNSTERDSLRIIRIPWNNLGVKFQKNRRLGFAYLAEQGAIPENADSYIPATWSNIKLEKK
ncbi:hypothetical protein [Chitinivibrio alkaliphilus]|uniref:Uncharacterized protein n=1 Tax=Chitinivibrio alkaliphilus ACht1 TaxID=1313304 RepID=U7D7R6_9BACT|nr:hypothetical protein [Chitinivibrio alkaliphilus]ERP31978.1 hypothetical protein CALK_0955 [Chitinivibrio alkaliphilus ACht1]